MKNSWVLARNEVLVSFEWANCSLLFWFLIGQQFWFPWTEAFIEGVGVHFPLPLSLLMNAIISSSFSSNTSWLFLVESPSVFSETFKIAVLFMLLDKLEGDFLSKTELEFPNNLIIQKIHFQPFVVLFASLCALVEAWYDRLNEPMVSSAIISIYHGADSVNVCDIADMNDDIIQKVPMTGVMMLPHSFEACDHKIVTSQVVRESSLCHVIPKR